MRRLDHYLSRYWVAIQADLQEVYHLDLHEVMASRRWRRALQLIEALRRPSRLSAAQAQDEDLAAAILDAEEAGVEAPPWSPAGAEFGLSEQLLTQLVDVTAHIPVTIASVAGSKAKPPKPMPRPETALERLREERRQDMQRDVMSLFSPSHNIL